MTIVDLNNLGYRDEPFALAQDVAQVFYIKDMSSKPKKGINKQKDHEPKRYIVLSGKRNIVGVEDKADLSEEYNNFVAIPPFEVNADPYLLHTCAVIIKKGHLSRESLLPLIFHILESFSIIIYKSNDNSNTYICTVPLSFMCYIIIYIY